MPKLEPKTLELYKALDVCMDELRKEIAENEAQIGAKPFQEWTQEKHDEYFRQQLVKCNAAWNWLFVRSMRIDPD